MPDWDTGVAAIPVEEGTAGREGPRCLDEHRAFDPRKSLLASVVSSLGPSRRGLPSAHRLSCSEIPPGPLSPNTTSAVQRAPQRPRFDGWRLHRNVAPN